MRVVLWSGDTDEPVQLIQPGVKPYDKMQRLGEAANPGPRANLSVLSHNPTTLRDTASLIT